MFKKHFILLLFAIGALSCENRDVTPRNMNVREIHEDIIFHFDRIWVDSVEYLILEKDRNNPDEGFGFMALKGNIILDKQDSILAMLKAQSDLQIRILSQMSGVPPETLLSQYDEMVNSFVEKERNARKIPENAYKEAK